MGKISIINIFITIWCIIPYLSELAYKQNEKTVHQVGDKKITVTTLRLKEFANKTHENGATFLNKEDNKEISSFQRCGRLCMYTERCCGFFFKINVFCRLVETYFSTTGGMVDKKGVMYYERKNPCNRNSSLCGNGTCLSDPQIVDHYQCKCNYLYYGKNCEIKSPCVDQRSNCQARQSKCMFDLHFRYDCQATCNVC